MKKLFIILLVTMVTMPLLAQQQYERKDFSFRLTYERNAEGEINLVNVGTYVGDKKFDEFSFELALALSEEMAKETISYSEPDINFDGYPDFDIYLGYMGGFANNTQHEALLWDQSQHRFIEPEGYGGIGEPDFDSVRKVISTVLSAGPDHRVTTYYGWQGSKLTEYLSDTWAIESKDDSFVDYSGVVNLQCHHFDAKLDGRIPVTIMLQKTNDSIAAGYIYYPKAKNPAPIMLAGNVINYDGTDNYNVAEYQAEGTITGFIHIEHKAIDQYDNKVEGTWINPKTLKELTLADMRYSHEAVKWFTQSLLTPEDPGNIGREYSFQQWDVKYQSMMGGNITFRAAGKNKVHFTCSNAQHNIAEGGSSKDRPAQLNGNVFEYYNLNECGYGFRATFFPRFVVLKTLTGYGSTDCFGMGASFDGVYIKVKK